MNKTFSFPCEDKQGKFKVRALEVNCYDLKDRELVELISTLTKKGFKIKYIFPYDVTFKLRAEIVGNRKDTQAIREVIEKEGFTEEVFGQD